MDTEQTTKKYQDVPKEKVLIYDVEGACPQFIGRLLRYTTLL